MRLVLSVLRCPPDVPPQTREFAGGEVSIGRGADNTWVLPDPERHLSKRHCLLGFHGGDWQLADTSANGTFLNGASEPLGPGMPRPLRDGDRVRLGAYEIEARLLPAETAAAPSWSDPFAPAPLPLRETPAPSPLGAITLPADFDPLAPQEDDAFWSQPTRPDHSPAVDDAFRLPSPRTALPDNWADDWASDPLPTPAAAPSRPSEPLPAPPAPPPAPPEPAAEAAAAPPSVTRASMPDQALLAAFFAGAGLRPIAHEDPEALLRQVGETLRAAVSGLREAMIARSSIKSEFRIDRTMIAARGNNPLKFSADDDDALASLVGERRRSDMPPARAVADALRDMRLHELATMVAMQAAVRDLVAKLAPAALLREAGGGALPIQRKARAWDAFEAKHAAVSGGLADDFDSLFGKSFARAYEQALAEISGREGPLR